ncbi:MAG: helix-hairpin-helix domain-containing protein [Psychrilyobacter sp.]|nr:helix-hairpin-helix domain-containing protein [Psychrilyobacter sp.]
MNQNIKLIIIITVVLLTSFVYNKIKPEKKVVQLKKELIYSSDSKDDKLGKKLNINTAVLEDYLKVGITLSIAKKVYNYRELVGRIDNLEELERLDGIGSKTITKLSKNLEIGEGGVVRKIKINTLTPKGLKYRGFTKKEVTKILKFKKENEVIYSNIDMMKILSEKRYQEYEDILNYNSH